MVSQKPVASLSLDLDNQWSYMKTHGDPGWEKFPTYLDTVVPRFMKIMDELDVKMTVFIVGQDAAREENHAALAQIPAAGHEVGNHSFHHEPWLHLYSQDQLDQELASAEEHIERATGVRPIGFRGPGFSFSSRVLDTLASRGYQYDCSTFPSFLGPLARAYYFMTAKLEKEEKEERKRLFGKFSEGFRPLKPYQWETKHGLLTEIPVTTMPIFKVPFHLSYLLYLGGFSESLARAYFRQSLQLCKWTGTEPSLLLHPLDFMGGEDVPELAFFPAMNQSAEKKMALSKELLQHYADSFQILTMQQHVDHAREVGSLKTRRCTL